MPKVFVKGFVTTLAIALDVLPIIFSPIIAFDVTFAVAVNSTLSKIGSDLSKDS